MPAASSNEVSQRQRNSSASTEASVQVKRGANGSEELLEAAPVAADEVKQEEATPKRGGLMQRIAGLGKS